MRRPKWMPPVYDAAADYIWLRPQTVNGEEVRAGDRVDKSAMDGPRLVNLLRSRWIGVAPSAPDASLAKSETKKAEADRAEMERLAAEQQELDAKAEAAQLAELERLTDPSVPADEQSIAEANRVEAEKAAAEEAERIAARDRNTRAARKQRNRL